MRLVDLGGLQDAQALGRLAGGDLGLLEARTGDLATTNSSWWAMRARDDQLLGDARLFRSFAGSDLSLLDDALARSRGGGISSSEAGGFGEGALLGDAGLLHRLGGGDAGGLDLLLPHDIARLGLLLVGDPSFLHGAFLGDARLIDLLARDDLGRVNRSGARSQAGGSRAPK